MKLSDGSNGLAPVWRKIGPGNPSSPAIVSHGLRPTLAASAFTAPKNISPPVARTAGPTALDTAATKRHTFWEVTPNIIIYDPAQTFSKFPATFLPSRSSVRVAH